MIMSVVATLCHMLATIPESVCREEVIVRDDMPMQACILAQAAIADWKNRSIYKSDEWRVVGYMCVPGGDYMPKDMT